MAIVLDGTTGVTTPGLTNSGTETIVNLTATGNTILGDASTDTLNVGNGGLVKDASGNVGIGTSSPGYKLEIVSPTGNDSPLTVRRNDWQAGEVRLNLALQYGISGYISSGITEYVTDTGYIALNYKSGPSTYAEGLRVSNTGNVGIGMSSPNTKLDVSGVAKALTLSLSGTTAFSAGTISQDANWGMYFKAATAGAAAEFAWVSSAGTERMRIDSSGRVTTPYQPVFLAADTRGATNWTSGEAFILNTTQSNIGSHYNTTNGRFTAPVSGFYSFSYGIYSYVAGQQLLAFKKNGSDFSSAGTDTLGLCTILQSAVSGTSISVYLSQNDYVAFGWRAGHSGSVYMAHSWFSGFLVG